MKHCIDPMILSMGYENIPGVICGVAKAFITQSSPTLVCFGAAIQANPKRLSHGSYERHAGTLLWIPSAMQISQTGARIDQLLCGADNELDWVDLTG